MNEKSRMKKRDLKNKYKKITWIKRLLDLAFVALLAFLIYSLAMDFYNVTDMDYLDERLLVSGKILLGSFVAWIVIQIVHGQLRRKWN